MAGRDITEGRGERAIAFDALILAIGRKAEAVMPSDWPAATKLRVSATRLKTTKPLRLSMSHS